MTAVDTNVLVRLLTGDDPKQEAAAQSLVASGTIWIAKTVLLETAWVLKKLYGFEESTIRETFVRLLGLENVEVEDELLVTASFDLMIQGVQFADAMHLNSRPPGIDFVSFDKAFVRRARRAGVSGVSEVSRDA